MGGLAVDLHGTRIGYLRSPRRTFDFHSSADGVTRFGLDSPALSVAIPLSPLTRRVGRAHRQAWFAGLLPEGPILQRLAAEADSPVHDTIALLRRYGQDVADALQIWDPDVPGAPAPTRFCPYPGARLRRRAHGPPRW